MAKFESPYYSVDDAFALYHGDCMDLLPQIPDNSVSTIFADPPYFLSNGGISCQNGQVVCVDKGDWDKGGTPEYIYKFNRQWLALCRPKLKDNGTIWISGTHHNIHVVMRCLQELDYKVLNTITWQKSDPPPNLSCRYFTYSAEYILWARKEQKVAHYYNYELMKEINGGTQMRDVWTLPGSCTTGIAANLLGRKFIGIDQEQKYLDLGIRRRQEMNDSEKAQELFKKMCENPEEVTVLVNHAKPETRRLMIEKGLCYLRAGNVKGSVQIKPGFERMKYVLLHTNGEECQLFRLRKGKEGTYQIWTKQELEENGFKPEKADYYVVLQFDNQPMEFEKMPQLKQRMNTYRAKICQLSEFIEIR